VAKVRFVSGHAFTACGKTRFCTCLWVAQRFTAAITGVFSAPALAAEVRLRDRRYFFRKLFRRAACASLSTRLQALDLERRVLPRTVRLFAENWLLDGTLCPKPPCLSARPLFQMSYDAQALSSALIGTGCPLAPRQSIPRKSLYTLHLATLRLASRLPIRGWARRTRYTSHRKRRQNIYEQ
jgi:hypothetical protein